MKTETVKSPIKCQGSKRKIIDFISSNICWSGKGKWLEPFVGSASVVLNIKPERALLADKNKQLIDFYKDLQTNIISIDSVFNYLLYSSKELEKYKDNYFYEVRERFNKNYNSLDFFFLNCCSFNGLLRYNKKGEFTTSFGHNSKKLSTRFIMRKVEQISSFKEITKNYQFLHSDFKFLLKEKIEIDDFVYLDPPYLEYYSSYYNKWNKKDVLELIEKVSSLPCKFALSSIKVDDKKNVDDNLIYEYFKEKSFIKIVDKEHFYIINQARSRSKVREILILN